MESFKKFLESDFSYLSIGHGRENFDTWLIRRKSDKIKYGSKSGKNPESLHDDSPGIEYQGRIDHNKKLISVMHMGYNDADRLREVVFLLRQDYTGYKIYLFGHGSPKEIH